MNPNIDTPIIAAIDEAASAIRVKTLEHGATAGDLFCLSVMEFFRVALVSKQRPLSKEIVAAVWEMRGRTAHFYYYHDFPIIYDLVMTMGMKAVNAYSEFLEEDLPRIGFLPEDWARFVASEAGTLFNNLPSHASYRRGQADVD